jgi:hypothetical protein
VKVVQEQQIVREEQDKPWARFIWAILCL